MSTKDPNMKVIFGADTKDFDKGAKEVKQGLKDLDKTTTSMLSSLGGAFGVSSAKVEQMTSAMKGLGQKLSECGSAGVAAFGNILKSISPVGGAIAGIGIATAIAGFKQLKAEADNFKSTIDGMNMSMATSAYISTYKQMLHDLNSDTGRQVAEAMDKWERGFGRFKAQIGATFTTAMGQDQKWYDAITPSGLIRAWNTVKGASQEAEAAAGRNAERASQMADLMKEQLTVNNDIKLIDRDIAEYRRQASDKTADAATRAEAEAKYRDAVNEKYDKQENLQRRMLDLQKAMDGEASNTFEETKKTAEMEGALIDIETARQNELRGIDRLSASIEKSTSGTAAAAEKARREAEEMEAVYSRWAGIGTVSTAGLSSLQGSVVGPSMSILPQRQDVEYFKETFQAYLGDWQLSIGIKPDEKAIVDFTSEIEDGLVSMATRTAEVMGNLIGTLAAGGNAWGDFKNAALSSLGDMAIAVGKIAIKTGVGMLGIQAALKMDNPYVAIAAGAALVALGAAVKSSLSAVASGDYSAGGGGYSGDYSSGSSSGYEQREVKVYVTGTLEADGDKLKAVLDSTNKKAYYTG